MALEDYFPESQNIVRSPLLVEIKEAGKNPNNLSMQYVISAIDKLGIEVISPKYWEEFAGDARRKAENDEREFRRVLTNRGYSFFR
jgi:hypothetical protein